MYIFKPTFMIAALGAAVLAPAAHAQPGPNPGQAAGQGIGYALITQERCARRPLRSPEAEKALQSRIVEALCKHTGASADDVRVGLAAGAMQASFAPKPTKNACKDADNLVAASQKL
jgi:hypothetical protein